jgi:hypothetical protein
MTSTSTTLAITSPKRPVMTPDLVNDRTYQTSIYGYYGCAPYWSAGYVYPDFNL